MFIDFHASHADDSWGLVHLNVAVSLAPSTCPGWRSCLGNISGMNEVRVHVRGEDGQRKFTSYRLAQGSGLPWVAHLHSANCPPGFPMGRLKKSGVWGMGQVGSQRQRSCWPVSGGEGGSKMMTLLVTCSWGKTAWPQTQAFGAEIDVEWLPIQGKQKPNMAGKQNQRKQTRQQRHWAGGVAGSACLFLFLPMPRFSLKATNHIYND